MRSLVAPGVLLLAACADDAAPAAAPPTVRMDFARAGDFFAAPFPSAHRGPDQGVTALPAPAASDYLRGLLALAAEEGRALGGYGVTAGVFVSTTAPLDPASLPDVTASAGAGASVFLTPAEGDGAGGRRVPVRVTFRATAPSGARNLLAAVPVQGFPLDPSRAWALVVTTRVRTVDGRPLRPSDAVTALRAGRSPEGLGDAAGAYRDALAALARGGVSPDEVAGLAVYRTGDPTARMAAMQRRRVMHPPAVDGAFAMREVFDDFCVFEATLRVPTWQEGAAPYTTEGGRWRDTDAPVATERSRLVLTVPRRAMPAGGFPAVVFVRTGGGGDRPLVDRGVRDRTGMAVERGAGPARDLAREGWAGLSWDGPHGGPRNVSMGDEQFLVFNVSNLGALRDNVRQSALEAAALADLAPSLRVASAQCPGAAPEARLDGRTLALMGHSMGASIAPLAAAFQPAYRAVILSGAGGSWIENIVHKERPLTIRPIAEALLRYNTASARLDTDDPVLSAFQWAMEGADVPPYASRVTGAGASRHVLMLQGIVDRYILPPIANTASLSLGLDLAGASLDARDARLMRFTPLERLLPLAGLSVRAGAVSANRGGATRVVRQYPEDGVEDGHEVAFQTDAPKRDYRCFLRGLARGVPGVPAPDARDCGM